MENEQQDKELDQNLDQAPTLTQTLNKKRFISFIKWFSLKRIIIIAVVIIVLGAAFYFRSLFVAATVNGTVITRLDVIKSLESQSGKAALESLINERLVNMEAADKNVSVSEEEVNAEFSKIEKTLAEQGTTLEAALADNGLTKEEIAKRITAQKKLEKMLADKINVTDAEVEQYIKDNGITLPAGKEAEAKVSLKEQISSNKISEESQKFVQDLNTKAKIKYWVNY